MIVWCVWGFGARGIPSVRTKPSEAPMAGRASAKFGLREFSEVVGESLGGRCAYFKVVCKKGAAPPIATVAAITACIAVYYAHSSHGWWFDPGGSQPWWRVLASLVSHIDAPHLWTNVLLSAVLGTMLEATERVGLALVLMWGGGLLGAALSAVANPSMRTRGFSGAIYALTFASRPPVEKGRAVREAGGGRTAGGSSPFRGAEGCHCRDRRGLRGRRTGAPCPRVWVRPRR